MKTRPHRTHRTRHTLALLPALCLLSSALCPLSSVRAALPTINDGDLFTITDTSQIGLPSTINFTGGSGTLVIAVNLTYDGGANNSNRVVISSGGLATIIADGATYSVLHSTNTTTTTTPSNGGAAFNVSNSSTLVLAAINGGGFLFDGNKSLWRGGAIHVDGANAVAFIDSATFLYNNNGSTQTAGGGVAVSSGTATITNSVFKYNTANSGAGAGAAITTQSAGSIISINNLYESNTASSAAAYQQNSAVATAGYFRTSTFLNNVTTGAAGGGAIQINANTSTLDIADSLFQGNTAGNTGPGGAINVTGGNSDTLLINNVIFTGNKAGGGGGVVALTGNTGKMTFTDSQFIGNTAGGQGGAIYIAPGASAGPQTLTLNVTPGKTSFIAGNKATASAISNFLYVRSDTTMPLTITASTAAGATLDMLDPMYVDLTGNGGGRFYVYKQGPGTWNLSGSNAFIKQGNTSGTAVFQIDEGTLNLCGPNETIIDPRTLTPYFTTAASLTFQNATNNNTMAVDFLLAKNATLGIGGSNSISYTAPVSGGGIGGNSHFSLAQGSNLAFNLDNAKPAAINPAPMLAISLGAMPVTSATLVTAGVFNPILNFNFTGSLAEGTYNLLSITDSAAGFTGPTGLLSTINFNTLLTTATFNGLSYADYVDFSKLDITAGLTPGSTDILWITFATPSPISSALSWAGGNANWTAATSWNLTLDHATATKYNKGDIINLDLSLASTNTITLDTGPTIGGMYLSGNASYTLAGPNTLTTDAAATTKPPLAATTAANGKLTLGAAADSAGAILTTPYTGTLTLQNTTNLFTAGIDILSGELVGNALNLATGTASGASQPSPVTLSPAGTLTFNQTTTATYSTPVTSASPGAGTLNKTGPATLTLAADNSSFTGLTTINTGTLRLIAPLGGNATINAGALLLASTNALPGAITVATGALFGGSGSAGAVTLSPGATLQIGDNTPSLASLLSLASLSLTDSILNYPTLQNQLTLAGPITLAGTSTLAITATTPGQWILINAPAGLTDSPASWAVSYNGAPLTAYTIALDPTGTSLYLQFAYGGSNSLITWTGAAATTPGIWDTTSINWKDFTSARPFTQGDIANITGAAPGEINLAASTTVTALYINGPSSYTFTGEALTTASTAGEFTGHPAASGKLILGKNADTIDTVTLATFTGTLDLTQQTTAPNNFLGGVEINSGALRISSTAQLGTTLSKLTLTGTTGAPASLLIAPNTTLTFDSLAAGSGSANRLVIAASKAATITLENSSTLTFSGNTAPGIGGAIYVNNNASLTLHAGPDSLIVFTRNTGTYDGGAFGAGQNTTLRLTADAGGGFLFTSNTLTAGRAPAFFASNTSNTYIENAIFTNNITTTGNGGAVAVTNNAYIELQNVLFTSNTGATAGALFVNTNASAVVRSSTFKNNYSTNGAIGIANGSNINIIDTDLLDNTSTALGGALYIANNNSSGTITVTTGTHYIAGNKAPSGAGIYLANNTNIALTINTAPGATLDMPDPLAANLANSSTDTITKLGPGTWNLGATSTFWPNNATPSAATVNFTIAEGTLHLYRAGQTAGPNGAYTAATGKLVNSDTGAFAGTPRGILNFTLKTSATLSAGGNNLISASKITLEDNTSLILDLTGATANTTAYSTLTLSATSLASTWNQSLTLLNLDTLVSFYHDTYNLITLTGQTATLFTSISTFTSTAGLIKGYELQLNPANNILQLLCTDEAAGINESFVLTWAGSATTWTGPNWLKDTTTTPTPATFNRGDIVNLTDTPDAAPDTTITIDTPLAIVAGMYLSGTQNYTLTGTNISASPTAGALTGAPAATGKLILGALASDDALALDTGPAAGGTATYTGTLTLANTANNFAAGIEIHTGHLIGNAATLGSGTAGILNNATLTFSQTTSGTYTAPISGSPTATLNKTGSATLTLAATNPFAGATNINEGALALAANATLLGTIHINPATTLIAGDASTADTVIIHPGATLQLGTLNSELGTLNTTTLTLNPGSTILYDLSSDAHTSDRITTATLDLSALSPGPATSATLALGSISAGAYELIHYTTLAGSFDPAAFQPTLSNGSPIPNRVAATLTNPANTLTLTVTISNTTLKWTGATNGNWDSLTANWTGGDTKFYNGDSLTLDDTATGTKTVAVPSAVTAADIHVDTASSYTINGAGAITTSTLGTTIAGATGRLVKDGPGFLNLANGSDTAKSDYTGGIIINSGTLQGNRNTLLGSYILNNATLILNVSNSGTIPTPISGTGVLVKQNGAANTLTLVSAAYTGGLDLRVGALTLQNNDPATQGTITFAPGTTLNLASTTDFTFAHPLTGTGGLLTLNANGHAVTFSPGALGASPAFTGTLALANSTYALTGTNATALTAATLRLDPGNTTTVGPADSGLQAFRLSGLSMNGGKLIFTATVPADLAATPYLQTTNLILTSGTIQVSLPAGNPAIATEGANLLLQASGLAVTRLVASTTTITGTNGLANLALVDQTGAPVNAATAKTITIAQNGANVATGTYNYALSAASGAGGGLSVNYKLTTLEILAGQTLALTSDPGMTLAQSTLATPITGNGNLLIDATATPVTLAAANTYTGSTTLAAGTLNLNASNALGAPTNTLALLGNSTLNLNATTQTLSTITTSTPSTLNLAAGTLDIASANPALASTINIAPAATINLERASSLGTGTIALNGALTITNTIPGAFANTLTGAGPLTLSPADPAATITITRPSPAYTGPATINGPVAATDPAALGASTVTVAATGTLTYNTTGTITTPITGPGALNLATPAGGTTTLAGNNTIANINALPNANIIALTPNALGTPGAAGGPPTNITLNAAKLTLATTNPTLGNLTMTGPSSLAFPPRTDPTAPYQTATIQNLTATPDPAGGIPTLIFNTDVGAGLSDKLIIPGQITGLFTATLANTGLRPDSDSTTLIIVQAASNKATIHATGVLNFPDAMSAYDYEISPDGSGAINLYIDRSTALGPTGNAIVANATGALPLTWFAELGTLTKRLGDLHIATRATPGLDLWLRAYTQRLNVNSKDTLAPFSETQYGTEVGADYGGATSPGALAAYFGVFAGIGDSTRNLPTHASRGDAASVHCGAYLTLVSPAGWYADFLVKYNNFNSTFNAVTDTNIQMTARYTTPAFGGSAEFGKRIPLGKAARWSLTPGLQAAALQIDASRYTTEVAYGGENLNIEQDGVGIRQLRAALTLDYKRTTKSGQLIQPYAKFALARQWTGKGGSIKVFNAKTGQQDRHSPYKSTIQGASYEAALGLNWQVLKTLQLYFEYDASWSRDYQKPYGLSLGFNHAW